MLEKRIENILDSNNMCYIKGLVPMVDDPLLKLISPHLYKMYFNVNEEASKPDMYYLIMIEQNSRELDLKEHSKDGYLKLNLNTVNSYLSRSMLGKTIFGFYITNEDKMFFKRGSTILNYIDSIKKKQGNVLPSRKVSYIKFTPDKDKTLYDKMKEFKYDQERSGFISLIGDARLITKNLLVIDEEEMGSLFANVNKYNSDFRLRFKTFKRILESKNE